MNKKLNIILILFFLLLAIYLFVYFYGITQLFHDPDDAEVKSIINQTVTAFQHETFKKEPFEKKQQIESLAQFLIKNANKFFKYNPDEFYKYDHCIHISATSKPLINVHTPINLREDLKKHIDILNNLVTHITLCNKNYNSINGHQPPGLSLFLKYSHSSSWSYEVVHIISFNESNIESNNPPANLSEEMLKKTPLTDDLYYIIRVIPISPGD